MSVTTGAVTTGVTPIDCKRCGQSTTGPVYRHQGSTVCLDCFVAYRQRVDRYWFDRYGGEHRDPDAPDWDPFRADKRAPCAACGRDVIGGLTVCSEACSSERRNARRRVSDIPERDVLACADCERVIADDERAWWTDSGTRCESCWATAKEQRDRERFERDGAGYFGWNADPDAEGYSPFASPFCADFRERSTECVGCGRLLVFFGKHCSEHCRLTAMRERRLVAPTEHECECCSETFTSRAGASYCSNACRQRAYRERGARARVHSGA